jgi:hypothetical protein
MKEGNLSKIWRVKSKDYPEVFYIKARTKPEAKKIFRAFLKSSNYWEGEPQLDFVSTIFKAYTDYIDCPGIKADDTRGDLMMSLVHPETDFIIEDKK